MREVAKLRESWIWPDAVLDYARTKMQGYTLNVCAGASELGDVQIDLDPENAKVQKMDMRSLRFDEETFDTVICDPPWKLGYYDRFRPFYECVRVCKVGGLIIYNATWIPHSEQVEILETVIRRDTHWGNVSVITVFRRTSL